MTREGESSPLYEQRNSCSLSVLETFQTRRDNEHKTIVGQPALVGGATYLLAFEEVKGNMLGKKFIIGGAQLYNHIYKNYKEFIDIVYETLVNCTLPNVNEQFSSLDFNISVSI